MAAFARRLSSPGRRLYMRAPLGAAVEFSAEVDEFLFSMEGVAKDISLGGMFIETDIPCLFGERVVACLNLPRSRHRLTLPATVRWTCAAGMGIQFGVLGARETHEITEFTGRHSAS